MLSLLKGAKEAKETPADVDMAALMAKAGLDRLFPSNVWPNVAAVRLVCSFGLHCSSIVFRCVSLPPQLREPGSAVQARVPVLWL